MKSGKSVFTVGVNSKLNLFERLEFEKLFLPLRIHHLFLKRVQARCFIFSILCIKQFMQKNLNERIMQRK